MLPTPKVKLALVDDHKLFRKGLISLIEMVHDNYTILFEADNGNDMQQKLAAQNLPDIVLMDINMPGMNGYESVKWLNEHYPAINVLVISMVENEENIMQMLKLGIKGYLSKDVEPRELAEALNAVHINRFYYTDFITGKLLHSLKSGEDGPGKRVTVASLSNREKDFLQLACSEMTYNEIAQKMFVSPKTVDGYRSALFEKFSVTSRVGLALYAIKCGLVVL